MSLAGGDVDVPGLPVGDLEAGTSVLLTGEDADALESAFARFAAAAEDERSVVLATGESGRTMRASLDRVREGAGERASILTDWERPPGGASPNGGESSHSGESSSGEDHPHDEDVHVEDLGDLTTLGMEYSNLVASTQATTGRVRSGVHLCSAVCAAVDDARSVFRFLNAHVLADVRRGDGVGVVALNTSVDLGVDVDSLVAGLSAPFSATVSIDADGTGLARIGSEELAGLEEPVEVAV